MVINKGASDDNMQNQEESLSLAESYVSIPPATEAPPEDSESSPTNSGDENLDLDPSPIHDPPIAMPVETPVETEYVLTEAPTMAPTRPMSAPPESTTSTTEQEYPDERGRKFGAGIVTAIIALPLLGPVFATAAGVAAAYGTTKPGVAGDACRAAGEVALTAKEKAKEVNQKHDIVNKTRQNTEGVLTKYEITRKIKNIMKVVLKNVEDAMTFVAQKVSGKRGQEADSEEFEKDSYDDMRVRKFARVV